MFEKDVISKDYMSGVTDVLRELKESSISQGASVGSDYLLGKIEGLLLMAEQMKKMVTCDVVEVENEVDQNVVSDGKRIYRRFTTEEKKTVVRTCISNDFNYSQTARQFNIRGSSTVQNWVVEFADEFGLDLMKLK